MRKWAILNRKSKGIYMYLCGLLSDIFYALLHFPGRKTEAQGTEETSLHLWLEGHPRKHLQRHGIDDFTCANHLY